MAGGRRGRAVIGTLETAYFGTWKKSFYDPGISRPLTFRARFSCKFCDIREYIWYYFLVCVNQPTYPALITVRQGPQGSRFSYSCHQKLN